MKELEKIKVKNGKLFGKKENDSKFREITSEDIIDVREQFFGPIYLEIKLENQTFRVSIHDKEYQDLLDWIQTNTDFDVKNSIDHKYIELVCQGKDLSPFYLMLIILFLVGVIIYFFLL